VSFRSVDSLDYFEKNWSEWGLSSFEPNRVVTRRELCVVLDRCLLLFGSKNFKLSMNGEFIYLKKETGE